ncbi:MAG: filamentous hemagglutinin N-terminal domain-containing protein, partial [Thiotrichaceae bacterium]|nr:filamentous hemagglutinin N-terminal domain-containing protein [Thiotrichaceae bacterium]
MIINNNHVVFRKKKLATALQVGIAMAFSIMSGEVLANPSGENVVHGDVNFDRSQADTLNVNQSSNKAIVNWQDFSVQRGETTNFNQPSVSSSTLNRVVGDNLSQIHGTINATGQVILINKNGVTFGKDGRVNTGGGFISSTMDVQNKDYLEGGDLTFEKGNSKQGVISNQGVIRSGGDVMLIGHSVTSSGAINTGGIAALAAGNKVVVDKQGAHIKQAPKPTRGNHQVTNSGTIRGASVQLKAAGHNPRKTAVRNTGDIYAHGGQPVRKAPVRKAPVKKAANAGRLSQAQIQAKRAQAARQAQFIKNAQAAKKAQATRQAQAIKNAQAAKKSQVARQ